MAPPSLRPVAGLIKKDTNLLGAQQLAWLLAHTIYSGLGIECDKTELPPLIFYFIKREVNFFNLKQSKFE
jgi:hypothetical protein